MPRSEVHYLPGEEWKADAACRGMPVSVFFIDKHAGTSAQTAVDVCKTCPVIDECRSFVLSLDNDMGKHGIWAGLTPKQRRGLKRPYRPRLRPPCGTPNGYNSHLRHRETPCDPCRAAHSAEVQWSKKRKRALRTNAA